MNYKIIISLESDDYDPVEDLVNAINDVAPYMVNNVKLKIEQVCSGCGHETEMHYGDEGMFCEVCDELGQKDQCGD